MYPNVITPSPLYQGLFRSPTVPSQSYTNSSFLVENLLRSERPLGYVSHPSGLAQRPPEKQQAGLSFEENVQTLQANRNSTSTSHGHKPYLKFGVNAILASSTSNPKIKSKYYGHCSKYMQCLIFLELYNEFLNT